jgi:hypothetical protein
VTRETNCTLGWIYHMTGIGAPIPNVLIEPGLLGATGQNATFFRAAAVI